MKQIDPFPNKLWFLRVRSTRLLKTLWKNEKNARKILNCRLQTLSVYKSLKFVVWGKGSVSCELLNQQMEQNVDVQIILPMAKHCDQG